MSVTMPRMIITTHDQDDALSELASRWPSLRVTAVCSDQTPPAQGAILVECGQWYPSRDEDDYEYEPRARWLINEDGSMVGRWFGDGA